MLRVSAASSGVTRRGPTVLHGSSIEKLLTPLSSLQLRAVRVRGRLQVLPHYLVNDLGYLRDRDRLAQKVRRTQGAALLLDVRLAHT